MTKKEIGKAIQKAIIEKKITYRQIRKLTGLDHSQIKKLIQGEPRLTVPNLLDLMKTLNIKFTGVEKVE